MRGVSLGVAVLAAAGLLLASGSLSGRAMHGGSAIDGAQQYLLFQPDRYPERLAARCVPFLLTNPEAENDSYVLERTDDLEFYIEDRLGNGQPVMLAVQDLVNTTSELTEALPRVRIPAILFDPCESKLATISFSGAGQTFQFVLKDGSPDYPYFEPGRTTLNALRHKLCRTRNNVTLRVRLLPEIPYYPTVGDALRIFRLDNWQPPGGDIQIPTVTQSTVSVDPDGYIWLPSPKSSVLLEAGETGNLKRRQFSQIDSSFFRVRVSFPGEPAGRAYTLKDIAESLACGDATCGGSIPIGGCDAFGCDAHVFQRVLPNAHNLFGVRYRVEGPSLTWTLVSSGLRTTMPFERGMVIDQGCEKAFQLATGKSIYAKGATSLTVYPDTRRNPRAQAEPFVLEIKPGQANNPDRAVVLPGDTIFVTQ